MVAFDVAPSEEVAVQSSGTYAQREARIFAATQQWFQPVLTAFNDAHRSLRARFAPNIIVPAKGLGGYPNPSLSVLFTPQGGQDLSAQFRSSNLDPTALLPGLLQAAQDFSGRLIGVPVDLSVYVVAYRGLAGGHISAPSPSWTVADFTAFCGGVALHGGRFMGRIARGGLGAPLTWLGFAEGYGGQIISSGKLSLTSTNVLRGLNALADVLHITWDLLFVRGTPSTPVVEFWTYSQTAPRPSLTTLLKNAVVRFPRAPVPVVPAVVTLASVPQSAPQPEAGATFALWLLSRNGQTALTRIGFPGMRTDMDAASWLGKGPAGVRPGDLRFAPPQLTALNGMNFTERLSGILLQPESARLPALQKLQSVANSVIGGDANVFGAGAQLNRDGIPEV